MRRPLAPARDALPAGSSTSPSPSETVASAPPVDRARAPVVAAASAQPSPASSGDCDLVARALAAGRPAPSSRAAAHTATVFHSDAISGAGISDATLLSLSGRAFSLSKYGKDDAAARAYLAFCENSVPRLAPRPVSFRNLGLYLTDRVVRRGLSAEDLSAHVTAVRNGLSVRSDFDRDADWLIAGPSQRALDNLMRALQREFPKQNARGKVDPLRLQHFGAMLRSPPADAHTSDQRSHWVQMMVAHQGFLRTKEHVSGALQRRDVTFLRTDGAPATALADCHTVVLTLRHTKTGVGEHAHQAVYLARRGDEFDAVSGLWQLLSDRVGSAADAPIFTSGPSRTAVTRELFIERVHRWATAAQLSGRFCGHSFRAGGATDAFDAGVPADVVLLQGRWRSEAWREYRRPTASVTAHLSRLTADPLRLLTSAPQRPPLTEPPSASPPPPCANPAAVTGPPASVEEALLPPVPLLNDLVCYEPSAGVSVGEELRLYTFRPGDAVRHAASGTIGVVVQTPASGSSDTLQVRFDGTIWSCTAAQLSPAVSLPRRLTHPPRRLISTIGSTDATLGAR
jgi:hypothetical protein